MSDDLDEQVRAALRTIPEDGDAPARIVAGLAEVRQPLGSIWVWGGAVVAGVAGFAAAFLQGPVSGPVGDATLLLLGGAL